MPKSIDLVAGRLAAMQAGPTVVQDFEASECDIALISAWWRLPT